MKLGALLLILVVGGIAVYGYFNAIPGTNNQTENLAQIEISPESFDFGEVDYGQIAEYTFKVRNSGEKVLEIKKVATSCACTTATIDQERINPGEEVDLQVVYDTGLMSGSHAKGEQERIIYIKSNDPINPQVEVMIYANVR